MQRVRFAKTLLLHIHTNTLSSPKKRCYVMRNRFANVKRKCIKYGVNNVVYGEYWQKSTIYLMATLLKY